jgi:galactosylceramidase
MSSYLHLLLVAVIVRCSSANFAIDDSVGLGMHFEGIGAISGGGATSKLLRDYEPKVASDIFDFLFKPNFGAALHMMKVEIGGDSDATEGAEPSHMHVEGEENYERGYECELVLLIARTCLRVGSKQYLCLVAGWMMKEARARNPGIKLYGLSWAWPGWLGGRPSPDKSAGTPFDNISKTVDYTMKWIEGAQAHHSIAVDYIGLWNERRPLVPETYRQQLQAALKERAPHVRIATGPHYPGTSLKARNCTAEFSWNETRFVDEEGSVADGRSARCLARCINRGYLTGCRTAIFQWHLISSFYDYLSYPRAGIAVAKEPWSGHYEVTSPTWAIAHTTQFSGVGWRYLGLDSGVGFLDKGGSYVTRIDTNTRNFSIVLEKMTYADSKCARQEPTPMVPYKTESELVVLQLSPSLVKACGGKLYKWVSDLSDGNSSPELFVNKGAVPVSATGEVSVQMMPNMLITLTSMQGVGGKGTHQIPAPGKFPQLHNDTFDNSTTYGQPRYFYDEMGAWEIQPYAKDPARGKVMAQVALAKPVEWKAVNRGPRTYFGDGSFNYIPATSDSLAGTRITFDVVLDDEGAISLTGGPKFAISTDGSWSFGKTKGKGAHFGVGNWSTLQYEVRDDWSAVLLDGNVLANTSSTKEKYKSWALIVDLSRYIPAAIDNFVVKQFEF